jgi:heme A synthase
VLALNVAVIIWGAFVRASHSGDGCGGHWPFCNGQVIPHAPEAGTVIEYLHRLSSGAAFLGVAALCLWAWRRFPRGHQIRLFSALSVGFIVLEGALGAGLVLFGLVGGNASPARAVYLSAHLTNTLLLLGSLTLTAWVADDPTRVIRSRQIPGILWAALGIDLLVSVTGVVAALGDTLYPAESISGGIAQDFLAASPGLLRLRLIHPLMAALAGLFLLFAGVVLPGRVRSEPVRKASMLLVVLVLVQATAGVVNIWLLAPVWMQLLHLFIGSLLWIVLVVLTAGSAGSGWNNGPMRPVAGLAAQGS